MESAVRDRLRSFGPIRVDPQDDKRPNFANEQEILGLA